MKNIDKEIEKTLASIDNLEKAKLDPYFYSRLTAKLEDQRPWSFFGKWNIAAIVLIILLNGISLFSLWSENSDTEYIDLLAEEYSTQYFDIYNESLE